MTLFFSKIWVSLLVSCLFGCLMGWLVKGVLARMSVKRLEAVYKASIDVENKKNTELEESIVKLKRFYSEQINLINAQNGLGPAGVDITDEIAPDVMDVSPDENDDLTSIEGITEPLEHSLNNLGIYKIAQLAQLNPNHINWVANRMGIAPEKIYEERWVQQAREIFDQNHVLH